LFRAPATITTEEILIVKSSQDFLFLFEKANTEKEKNLEIILSKIKESFGSLSHEALIKNTEEFLKLADVSLSKQTQSGVKDLE
jgi:hypothetical protein